MDRFIRGEDVPYDTLRQVWQNTTRPHPLWDVPIYEEFFRTVRDVNLQLPHQRHLRVILGDPPIDWDALRTAEEHRAWIATPIAHRDRFPFEVIQREVVARKRRALVIYGDLHFNRWNPQVPPGAADRSNNIVDLLEQSGVKVFSIHTSTIRVDLRTLQQDIGSWPKPSLSILEGTTLGAADFTTYYPAPNLKAADGRPLFPRPMAQQFDAVLYLGSPSEITQSRLSPALCADAAYMTMRRGRINLLGMKRDLERLDEQCRTVRN